jgi:anti-sigma B factor antagonist
MVTAREYGFAASRLGDGVVLVEGELDIVTAALLEAELREAVASAPGDLVVDLAGISFMDSAGMNVLARIYKLLDGENRSLILQNAKGSVRRALEIGGASVFAALR